MQSYKPQTPLGTPYGGGTPNLPYFAINQLPSGGPRVYNRRGYSVLTTLTLPFLWTICVALWIIRFVPLINQAPLPAQVSYIGPIVGAALALVYGNWMKTILSRIAVGELEINLGRSRQWLDAMTGNTAFATNFRSFKSIAIFLTISSASILSAGVNYALTVQPLALTLHGTYRLFAQYQAGSCSQASVDICPSRQALPTTYTVNVNRPSTAYMVQNQISYTWAAAGASAGDVAAAVWPLNNRRNARGSLCASVPSSASSLYTCKAVSASATSSGVTVGGECYGSISMTAGENGAMGWQRCVDTDSLPTYVIAATDGYARNLQLAMGLVRAVGNDPSAYAIQCDPVSLSPSGRVVTFTVNGGGASLIHVDSDGTPCNTNVNIDYAELAKVSLDLMLGQFEGADGWMDALMKAAAGDDDYGESQQLAPTPSGLKPIEAALSLSMAGVLSQANLGHGTVYSSQYAPYTYTPSQYSFRQLPVGQALVSLALLLSTMLYFYGRRYRIDSEWQNGNMTLRLLSIDPIHATGGQLCNATNQELRALDHHRLGAVGQHICLVTQGDAIHDKVVYGRITA